MERLVGGTFKSASLCDPNFPADASLYTFDKVFGVQRNFNNMRISSGLDWNTKEKKFYHNSACSFNTMEYDWNPQNGNLCKQTIKIFYFIS